MSAEPSRSFQTAAIASNRTASQSASISFAGGRECVQQAEGLPPHRNPLRQAGAKPSRLCLPRRRPCMVDLMSLDPSTTLADLFTPLRLGDLSFAVRASLRPRSNDEFDDGVAYGRQARLRRWAIDSFFSVPLVRDGGAGGMRRRSWS